MHRVKVFVALVLLALTGRAFAQEGPPVDPVKAMVGTWEISNSDGDKTCMVGLQLEATPGGHKLQFDKACAEAFPLTADVTAWTIAADGLFLLDSKGKSVLDLDEVENGIFEGVRPEGRYVMRNLAAVRAEPKPDQVFGDWDVSRGTDTPICVITFSNSAVGDSFALQLKPGCDALVSSFNPTSWRMENGELLLTSAQGIWRFDEAGPTTWQRVPEDPIPLWLVRSQP